MPSSTETVTIAGEIYTLDGLIQAYNKQLADFEKRVDKSATASLEYELSNRESALSRLILEAILRVFRDNTALRTGLISELQRNDTFIDQLVSRLADVMTGPVMAAFEQQATGQFDEWWSNRQRIINTNIDNAINERETAATVEMAQMKHVLRKLLEEPMKDALKDTLKETHQQWVDEQAAAAPPAAPAGGSIPAAPGQDGLPEGWSTTSSFSSEEQLQYRWPHPLAEPPISPSA